MLSQIYHLQPWEEATGQLHELNNIDGRCLTRIGSLTISLPQDIGVRLKEMLGKRIAVLRTDRDFRLRSLDAEKSHE